MADSAKRRSGRSRLSQGELPDADAAAPARASGSRGKPSAGKTAGAKRKQPAAAPTARSRVPMMTARRGQVGLRAPRRRPRGLGGAAARGLGLWVGWADRDQTPARC